MPLSLRVRALSPPQGGDLQVCSDGLGHGSEFTALMRLGNPVWSTTVDVSVVAATNGSGDARSRIGERIASLGLGGAGSPSDKRRDRKSVV